MSVRRLLGAALLTIGTMGCQPDSAHTGENSPGSFSDHGAAAEPAASAAAAAAGPAGGAPAVPATAPVTAAGDVAPPVAGTGSLTDANILAVMHEANAGEMAAARMAVTRSTNARVQSFAREMIHDHARLDRQGALVASAINVRPTPPANDSLAAHVTQESAQLTAAAPGAAFDTAYIDAQVQDHETVLALLQQFQSAAKHSELKTTITNAIPVVQKHLDQARAIQVRITGASSAT